MVAENRIYQAYYTKSEPIVHYMVELLELKGAETILEPCAGDGIFIDFIIDKFKQVKLDAFELNCDAFKLLSEKYDAYENVIVKQTDTLTDIDLELGCSMGGNYDAIIANPPYGAWRAVEHRKKIKKMYNGLYAKESYALFLYRCIEALKDKGKLVFIIPDTYLNLHRHKGIRRHILTRTKIKEIALFPSSYFPGVNFGYANLSIISLEKCSNNKEYLNNEFEIIKGFRDVSELNSEKQNHLTRITISQQDVFQHSNYAFITTSNTKVASLLQSTKTTIGDLCNCVTGFYSGNDKCFLKVRNKGVRNAKRYDTVDLNQVAFDCEPNMIQGLEGEKAFVPIVKGGNTKYYKPDNWFMSWSKELVVFFKKDKKARYQNAAFYFQKGIAVPMVSSKSITGALIENRLFDQSIVGVFPKEESILFFLLSFFNSPTCNQLIRTINPSTNNSANYIKKIPFLIPEDKHLLNINQNIQQILLQIKETGQYDLKLEIENNELIKELYGF